MPRGANWDGSTVAIMIFFDLDTGNRTRAEDIRDHTHPYMRPGPFFPGQFPAANVHLLKDGRLAPTGMELGTGDPRLGTLDIGKCVVSCARTYNYIHMYMCIYSIRVCAITCGHTVKV